MTTHYPLQPLLAAHGRRLERALSQLAAAQHAVRQGEERLQQAQQQLDQAVLARNRLQWQRMQSLQTGAAVALSGAELGAPALRLGLLQDRIATCDQARETAAQALDQASQLLAQAREVHRRARAKHEALLNHQADWRRQRSAQRLRREEAGLEDLQFARNSHRSSP